MHYFLCSGLDYWLDNLMFNVPEVAMCFHSAGVIQKYQRIKTEELPKLKNSKFDPELVKDIAQHILAFLKDNTTHEGHTYWLVKSKLNKDKISEKEPSSPLESMCKRSLNSLIVQIIIKKLVIA